MGVVVSTRNLRNRAHPGVGVSPDWLCACSVRPTGVGAWAVGKNFITVYIHTCRYRQLSTTDFARFGATIVSRDADRGKAGEGMLAPGLLDLVPSRLVTLVQRHEFRIHLARAR